MGWVLDSSINILDAPELAFMSLLDYLNVSLLVMGIPWIYDKSIQERYHTIRQKQQDLEIKQKELEHTIALRDRFIASVSHELRTPMNAILGLNQVLLSRVTDKPEAQKVLKYTQQSADHLMTVINDVLDYSQFISGEITANKESFRLREVIRSAFDLFSPRTETMAFSYRCEVDDDVPQWVMGDRHRLMQVLVNLLGNAVKFTLKGEVVLKVSRSPDGVTFSVQDSGIGIAQENLEKIFERFAQADSQTQTRYGGTGLGLTISRQLVALLGGKLEVSSTVNEGSRFWFSLPMVELGLDTLERGTDAPALPMHRTKQARFLVVDDQVVNRKLVRLILKQHCADCHVSEATQGLEALNVLAKEDFDVVIMDMVMPEMDGIEATQRIRASGNARLRQMPVLGLTANITQSDLMRFGNAGVDEIMLKPLQVERFIQSIERLMQRER
jgi:signal transduction histidine kinase/CheY-like chemotaxis protein